MGLSSKQVISSDGLDWSQTLLQEQTLELPKPPNNLTKKQQNQQQLEPLKCPRCDSTNTKFCYYNNYSKSQPRHFCKACKRHWTKGGTLRNVPLGGGRKNKRLKASPKATTTNNTTSAAAATTSTRNNTRNIINRVDPDQRAIQAQRLGIGGDQKNMSNILYQALIRQPSSAIQQDSINLDNTKNISDVFLGSSMSLPQSQNLNFPYQISSSFDTNSCAMNPTSFQPSSAYNYSSGEAMVDSTITTIFMPSTSSSITPTWQLANTSNNGMDWNWDDIENFVSTDLNMSWDDPDQVKPV